MNDISGLQLLSTLAGDGTLTVELMEQKLTPPRGFEVLVRVEASPINPSDLGMLLGPADVEHATYSDGRIVARMPDASLRAMATRIGEAMPVGNEGAGTVIAAGDAAEAQALLGQVVTCAAGGMYAQYKLVDARTCMALPKGATARQGASALINPMTALGFVETMRAEGHKALVNTAAASNLGQMLVKICQEENVPLVNIVRNAAQVDILKAINATYVIDSSADGFADDLFSALDATGATIAFDAIGGGTLAGQLLATMEAVASKGAAYNRYGTNVLKQVYIYGGLDASPTVVTRNFGFGWRVGGWLLTPFLTRAGADTVNRMRARIRDKLTTTFASHYKAHISLQDALKRDVVMAYNARRTGEKYLIVPN